MNSSIYYKSYYDLKKLQYRCRYLENKEETQREKDLYKNHGGKEQYYKNQILKFIKNGNEQQSTNKD
jgi:hypothetical protein|tara:strand:- start:671 stop:871 length:201 start_codon:yes stop_codon:yes gene_type:complete